MRDERGFTLVELLVSMMISVVVLLAIMAVVDVTTRGSARVASRVDADQRARVTLQRLFDELHSTCVAPNVLPVVASSNGYQSDDNNLIFLEQSGSSVSPTPDEHVVTLANGTLTERIFPATGGTAPTWTFASTPSSTTQLLTGVGPASSGGSDGAAVPVLRVPGGTALDDAVAHPGRSERHGRRPRRGGDGFLLGRAGQ